MSVEPGRSGAASGILYRFARHRTAANLLMVIMLVAGIASLIRMNTQFFPDFGIDIITVSVEWRGATAEDVDLNIVDALEPELRFLDGVKRVRSTAYDGRGTITVEFESGTDMQSALANVESAVDQVTTLPNDSEEPEIRRIVRYDNIARLVVSGDVPERALKAIAKDIRDDLLARGIDKVDIYGDREEEIWVSVEPEALLRLDLTLSDIAAAIREISQDLPSGDIAGGERQVRSLGLLTTAEGIADVDVKATADGRKVRLGDLATVTEDYEEGGRTAIRNGNRAIELHVQRALGADALELADVVDETLAELQETLPPTVRIERYDVAAALIRDRISVLVWNGLGGLVLVLAVLFLFLNGRVAFWVAMGIPTALMATMAVMLLSGQTINMVSLFGLIMALGIVVDDAIVVGEHAEWQHRQGLAPLDAAVTGAQRMAAPVTSSTLTTVAAFLPLFVISGIIGEIIFAIPAVVVCVLIASLIECFFVLPGHMAGALKGARKRKGAFGRFRQRFDAGFERFKEGWFRRRVEWAVAWRYSTLTAAIALFALAVGTVKGGHIGFHFFPSPESDVIYANVQVVAGSKRSDTERALLNLEASLDAALEKLDTGDSEPLVAMVLGKVGTGVGRDAAFNNAATDTVGGLIVELKPSDSRDVRTSEIIAAWQNEVRPFPGLENLSIREAQGGPPGRDVDIRLLGQDPERLKAASEAVQALLARLPGVSAIEDDLPWGKPESIIEVTPRGRALGFTTESVGRQVRDAIDGAVARRFPRGEEEVTIRVQYPRDAIGLDVLDHLYLRAPGGAEVPLLEVVAQRDDTGFAQIKREDGKRQVAITAEIDRAVTSTGSVIDALTRTGELAAITTQFGVTAEFRGKAEEQAETFADMTFGAGLALISIYIILAWVFGSYARPLAVLAIIPLGFVGAVFGHWLLGFDLTILSLVALIGLSGIVINDSIVLVTTIDHRRKNQGPLEAIVDGTCDRLRAVILTSATTIGGLLPLMFERSLQAQFLIPMALTIVAGLAVATFMILLVLPALLAVQEDLKAGWRWVRGRLDQPDVEEEAP